MKKYLVITILLFFIKTIHAQSVTELLQIAVKENVELKILENEYLAALEKAPQVNELPDPEVGVGIFPLPVETRLGPQLFRVGATQMLPWKGLLDGKKDLAIAMAKPLYERLGARILDIRFQIEQAYFRLYELEKSQAIIQRNISLLKSLEQLALSKVESGKATAADVLRVQLKEKEMEQELLILEKRKIEPTATINQLLQRELEIQITIPDTLVFANIVLDKEAMLQNIATDHPMLRMFELQQEASKQAITLNGLNGKPSFGVGLDYINVRKRKDAEPVHNGRDIIQLRASVKIPLYKNKYEAKEREENFKILALEQKKTDLLSQFSAAIEKGYAEYETAQLRMNLYKEQIEITRSAISILETIYSVKGNNFDELLRMEKELIDYDLKILKAIVQSHLAKSKIERFLEK